MHPLSWKELQLIEAYRAMTPDQRELINRAMGITTQQPKQDDSEILRRHRKEPRI